MDTSALLTGTQNRAESVQDMFQQAKRNNANEQNKVEQAQPSNAADKVTLQKDQANAEEVATYDHLSKSANKSDAANAVDDVIQALINQRLGIDSETLDKIEQKIAALEAKENLSKDEKAQLEALQNQKAELVKEASERQHGEQVAFVDE